MNYVPYNANDRTYFGAARAVEIELEHVRRRRRQVAGAGQPPLAGIALSGGGIRSASFCLGALQAMAYLGWLKHIDYLSTVSGGGYIGSSVTWLLHKTWKMPREQGDPAIMPEEFKFGVDTRSFPYGTYPMVGAAGEAADFPPRYQGALLRFLRQHARYLTPGNGVNTLALIAAVLRSSLYSILFYGALIVALFLLIGHPFLFAKPPGYMSDWISHVYPDAISQLIGNWALLGAATAGALFAALVVPYAVFTRLAWHIGRSWTYYVRRCSDIGFGVLLLLFLLLVVFGVIPEIYGWIPDHGAAKTKALWTGGGSIAGGIASAVASFMQTKKVGKKPLVSAGALAIVGASLLIFGFALLAYGITTSISESSHVPTGVTVLVVTLVAGSLVNINYMSMHRFYRDRLMELFLPDVEDAVRVAGPARSVAHEADKVPLQKMCGASAGGEEGTAEWIGPYHLINTNLLLVSSDVPKFKVRGGDNFVLSPLWCGSNATGWTRTKAHDAYNRLSLASAMAISGAAVNPNTGSGGQGATRRRAVSLLMGLLNIRLGYWIENPMPVSERERIQKLQGTWLFKRFLYRTLGRLCHTVPNAVCPGLLDVWLGLNLDETSRMVQLSDGGHFENLGLYELVRRRLKLIIVCDGAADPEYLFDDLANALEKIRVDFGALVTFEGGLSALEDLIPHGDNGLASAKDRREKFAQRGYICGTIEYAPADGKPDSKESGTLIYLTTTFFKGLPADLYGYRRTHPEFPDEPTADQSFDERQFEAYRELGYNAAFSMINDENVRWLPDVRETMKV